MIDFEEFLTRLDAELRTKQIAYGSKGNYGAAAGIAMIRGTIEELRDLAQNPNEREQDDCDAQSVLTRS
jgi:hypothetical protein